MNVYVGGAKDYSAMRGPAPEGFHVPLATELQGLKTIMNGLGLTTGGSWRINLHMPFAGYRYYSTADLYSKGSLGFYWSSSPYSAGSNSARYLYLDSSNVYASDSNRRADGLSVRCFKDSYETPTSSWTVVQGTLGSAGIFWNQSQGLISITDGTTGYTMMDKNLGATTVYNDGDTLSDANMGYMHQWGNNYGFPSTGSVTTSSTQVNASAYGPGNYYSSSTFITGSADWSSVHNDNLRGGVTGIISPAELKNAYIGESPYEGDELCFTANTAGSTIKLNKVSAASSVTLETSRDGTTWTTYTFGNTITLSNIGDKVYWRNTSTTDTQFGTGTGGYYQFVMTGSINGSGDVNYLLNKNSTTTVSNFCFNRLFYQCTSLKRAPSLPATTLAKYCYYYMFYGCTGLTTVPALPATTLAERCYEYMFGQCTYLYSLPKLPATTLADYCYKEMFAYCSSIALSATQTGYYQTPYRIPVSGTGTAGTNSLYLMFTNTGGTFKGTPSINTTYYTFNTVV